MNRITTILLPFALLLGACDSPETEDIAADEPNVTANADAAKSTEGKRGRGRMAKLDADKDGAISLAEAKGTRLAAKFTALDGDADGKLSREEMRANHAGKGGRGEGMKGERHGMTGETGMTGMTGKTGKTGKSDPAARAAKILEKRDADKNGSLSPAELQGSRIADKFAALDTDRSGAVSRDELVAFKTSHRKGGAQGTVQGAAK